MPPDTGFDEKVVDTAVDKIPQIHSLYAWVSGPDNEEVIGFNLLIWEGQRQWLLQCDDYSESFFVQLRRLIPREYHVLENPRYELCILHPTDEALAQYQSDLAQEAEMLEDEEIEELSHYTIDMRDCADVLD